MDDSRIGKVVVTLGGIFVGGVVLYKVSSTTTNKVKSWLIERAEIKILRKRWMGYWKR